MAEAGDSGGETTGGEGLGGAVAEDGTGTLRGTAIKSITGHTSRDHILTPITTLT